MNAQLITLKENYMKQNYFCSNFYTVILYINFYDKIAKMDEFKVKIRHTNVSIKRQLDRIWNMQIKFE